MRLSLGTVNVPDEFRKELRKFHGKTGIATREECRDYLLATIQNEINTLDAGSPDDGMDPE